MTLKPKIAQYVADIIAALQNAGYEAYIVGGAVRDFLLDRQPKDYDLSTSATPEEIKKVFRKQRCMIIGRRFRLVHLYHGKEILEISTFRKKPEHLAPAPEKMNPGKVAAAPENMIFRNNESGTVQEDAWRRDFTVNALFYDPVNDEIHDYTGLGLEDIRNGVVRIIGEPVTRLEEDPVRILRALKLVGQYGFRMEPETERAVRTSMPLIRLASDSRMTLELEKILKSPYGDRILEAFYEYGFLEYFLPALNTRWNDPDMIHMRELWRVRNERIRQGEYRESISLAMSLIVLPFAEKQFVNRGSLFTYHPGIENELKNAIGRILRPRVPTKRAVAAAVRTLLLQPKFLNESEDNRERLRSHPGYSHARELALIHNTVHSHSPEFEQFWPKGDPNRKPKRRRSIHRGRNRGQ